MRRALEVFQYRNYRLLWFSSLFSFTGMQMQQVARALLAWELTGSFAATGIISLSFGLPMLLFALIGGSLADRVEKRNLTLVTQGTTGILALITAVLVATDLITMEFLFVIGLVQGTFFAFGMPARTPLMAEVVGPEKIMSAIAMSNAAMNFTRLFGPAAAGGLVGLWGIESAYFVQASLYVFSSTLLLMVPTGAARLVGVPGRGPGMRPGMGGGPGFGRPRPQGGMIAEIGVGLSYVAHHPRLRLLIGMMFIVSLFGMPYVMLLAGFVQEDLGQPESAYGVLQSITGVGALIASLGVATFTEFDRKPLVQWVAGIMAGVGLILLALSSGAFGYGGAIFAVVVLGLATTAYQTLNNTMVMSEADPEYYGRVMSINMLTFSVMPLMAAPLGVVADIISAPTTFIIQGSIIVGLMLLVALFNSGYTFGREHPPATHEGDMQGREAPALGAGVGGGGGGGG